MRRASCRRKCRGRAPLNVLFLTLLSCLPRTSSSFRILHASTRRSSVALSAYNDATIILSDGQLVEESFQELYGSYLPSWLIEKCNECGWTHPSRIQQSALDAILIDKKDAIIQAETGSGKTLSYLLPCLASVDASRSAVQAMIVVPTRELGMQVARVAKRLAAASSTDQSDKLMVMSVLQGSQNRRQRAWAWAEPPHVVIGTPQELCDMVRFGGIKKYNAVQFLVVDEVDACLLNNAGSMSSNLKSGALHELLSKHLSPSFDDGTGIDVDSDTALQQVQKASASAYSKQRPLSRTRQTVFCSATIPQHRHFLKQCVQNQWMLREPTHVCLRTGEQLLPQTLDHVYVTCRSATTKLVALRRLLSKVYLSSSLETPKKVLVFCEPRRPMRDMEQVIDKDLQRLSNQRESPSSMPVVVDVLQLEDNLSLRAAAMDSFGGETGRYDGGDGDRPTLHVLLSTDLAARGLDIVDISHVIHYDLPLDADTYTHRSGRAGRFGRNGQVLSIIADDQEFALQRLANKVNVELRCVGRQRAASVNQSINATGPII
jgi:superfamily II DNA/RNA helicase